VKPDGNEDPRLSQPVPLMSDDATGTSDPFTAATVGTAPRDIPAIHPQPRDPGRYQIIGEHGHGGLGRVFRAHDRELGRDIAIKELILRGNVSEVRFQREALITARLEHPGIVPVHEAGRWPDGTPFYAMKLVSGRSLRDLIAERSTVDERIGLLHHVIAVADAIAYAHGRNIIHRDLKPANIIVGDFGETIVIDWGLAKDLTAPDEPTTAGGPAVSRDSELTEAGAVLGTPAYMAPEQERGEQVDQRADVFAIGAMLWELCALQKVPPPETRHRDRMLRDARIDKDLATIINKAVDPDPRLRYPDAGALAADLRAFKSGARIAARSYSLFGMLAHWTRRHRSLAVTVTIAAVLAVIGVALYVGNIAVERDRADSALKRAEAANSAISEANRSTERAYDDLSLKNGELLLASDPSAASDALGTYHGPDQDLANLLRAKAEGLGVARLRVSPHSDTVYHLQPLSNGSLLSISEDGTVAMTGLDGKSTIFTSNAGARDISSYAPAREVLAYACQPEGICVLDPIRQQRQALKTPGRGLPGSLSFSPDGYRLAARYDDSVVVWDVKADPAAAVLKAEVPGARQLMFVSDGQLVVIARRQTQLLTVGGGAAAPAIDLAASAFASAAGELVLGNDDGEIALVRVDAWPSRVARRAVCDGRINAVTILHARRVFAYACQDGEVGLRALDDPARLIARYHHDGAVLSLARSADDRYMISGGQGGDLEVYDLVTGAMTYYKGQLARIDSTSGPSPAFPYFASGDDNGAIRVWKMPANIARPVIRGRAPFYDVTVLNNATVVGIGGDAAMRWWQESRAGAAPAHEGGGIAVRRSPDGAHFATFGYDGKIILWGGSPVEAIRRMAPGPLNDLEFLRDGRSIVSAGGDGRLLLWTPDQADPQLVTQLSRPLASIEVLRQDDSVIVAERGGSVWQVSTRSQGRQVQVRAGHGEAVSRLVASDDGQWVGVGTSEGDVVLYPTATWKPISLIKTRGSIRNIAFSPDMSLVSVLSEDEVAYLLPFPGRPVASGFHHWRSLALPARGSRFSPDGRFLAITTSDGGVFFYSLLRGTWRYVALPVADVFFGGFSPDGSLYATADSGAHITLFDATRIVE